MIIEKKAIEWKLTPALLLMLFLTQIELINQNMNNTKEDWHIYTTSEERQALKSQCISIFTACHKLVLTWLTRSLWSNIKTDSQPAPHEPGAGAGGGGLTWGEKGVLVSESPTQGPAGGGGGGLQKWGVPRADAAVEGMGDGVSDGRQEKRW